MSNNTEAIMNATAYELFTFYHNVAKECGVTDSPWFITDAMTDATILARMDSDSDEMRYIGFNSYGTYCTQTLTQMRQYQEAGRDCNAIMGVIATSEGYDAWVL